MAEISPVVASAQTYEVCLSYYAEGDTEAKSVAQNIMRTTLAEITNAELVDCEESGLRDYQRV